MDATQPLSRSEFQQLASWLESRGASISGLLAPAARASLSGHSGADRILHLLRRQPEVERLLESWERLGIWTLSERDPLFPPQLRRRLGAGCLPLLFGAGAAAPISLGGLCVVGSRDCTRESLDFARLLGTRAASEGLVVISSDMRGVDREVIAAALAAGGRVICLLSDALEKTAASGRYRQALAAGRATLVSPFLPGSHFAVANAMRAHRYRYGLADAAIIVEARRTGGIWTGADENRRQQWVPAFVRADANAPSANSALLHLGLLPITQPEIESSRSLAQLLLARTRCAASAQPSAMTPSAPAADAVGRNDLYAMFLAELALLEPAARCCAESIARHFAIEPLQASAWLGRAQREGRLSGPTIARRCGAHAGDEYNQAGTSAPC